MILKVFGYSVRYRARPVSVSDCSITRRGTARSFVAVIGSKRVVAPFEFSPSGGGAVAGSAALRLGCGIALATGSGAGAGGGAVSGVSKGRSNGICGSGVSSPRGDRPPEEVCFRVAEEGRCRRGA